MTIFLHAAGAPRTAYDANADVRAKTEGVREHLRELALDLGLNPDSNVAFDVGDDFVRVGISEYMDEYLRDNEPGLWTN